MKGALIKILKVAVPLAIGVWLVWYNYHQLTAEHGKRTALAGRRQRAIESQPLRGEFIESLATARIVAVYESYVRRYPMQWYNFHDFWASPAPVEVAPPVTRARAEGM